MRQSKTLRLATALLAMSLAACLTSCGGAATAPDEFRLRPVPYPAIPAPGPDGYTDAQNAGVLAAYDAALTEANARLCWLAAYWNKRPEGCRVE